MLKKKWLIVIISLLFSLIVGVSLALAQTKHESIFGLLNNQTFTNIWTQSILVNGINVCLADGTNCPTAGGSMTFSGNVIASNLTVTGTTSLQGTTWTNATGTHTTSTSFFAVYGQITNATMTSIGVTNILVGGLKVCLADGTNCPSSAEADTLLTVTNRGSVATSSVTFYGGLTASNITATSSIIPNANNTVDIGTPTLSFKNIFASGTIEGSTLQADSNVSTNWITAPGSYLQLDIGGFIAYQFQNTSFYPMSTNAVDLGQPQLSWKNVYASGTVISTGTTWINATGTNTTSTNLGWTNATAINTTSTNFFATYGQITNATSTNINGTNIFASSLLNPYTNNSVDLGTAVLSFKNVYASGTVITNGLTWTNATGTNTTSTNFSSTYGKITNSTSTNINISNLLVSSIILPSTNNSVDIGTSTLSFRNIYASGTVIAGGLNLYSTSTDSTPLSILDFSGKNLLRAASSTVSVYSLSQGGIVLFPNVDLLTLGDQNGGYGVVLVQKGEFVVNNNSGNPGSVLDSGSLTIMSDGTATSSLTPNTFTLNETTSQKNGVFSIPSDGTVYTSSTFESLSSGTSTLGSSAISPSLGSLEAFGNVSSSGLMATNAYLTTVTSSRINTGSLYIGAASSIQALAWANANVTSTGIENYLSMTTFNGYLYVGAGTSTGDGDISYCIPTMGGTTTLCDNSLDWFKSFDNTTASSVWALLPFNNRLYDGEGDTLGAGIIRMCNPGAGTSTVRCDSPNEWSIATTTAFQRVKALTEFNGMLYAGVDNFTKYNEGAGENLTDQIVGVLACNPASTGSIEECLDSGSSKDWYVATSTSRTQAFVTSTQFNTFAVFKNRLYAFFSNSSGIGASGDNAPTGPINWWVCNPTAASSTTMCDAPGDWTQNTWNGTGYGVNEGYKVGYSGFYSAAVYGDYLYLGLGSTSSKPFADLVVCNPSATSSGNLLLCDRGNEFATTTITAYGTTKNSISSLQVFDGKLYIGYAGAAGDADIDILDQATTSSAHNDGTNQAVNTMTVYNRAIYAGKGTASGNGSVWVGIPSRPALSGSVAFQVSSVQGSGNNDSSSTGYFWFSGDPSGVGGRNDANPGSFKLSHGLVTQAGAYDIAETYQTDDLSLSAGEVVSFDEIRPGNIRRSTGSDDSLVFGVISSKAGFTMAGEEQPDNKPVALAGRVEVNISGENGEIKIGDPLTASKLPGYASKAVKSGIMIGRAMENFNPQSPSGTGHILMYIQNGYFVTPTVDKLEKRVSLLEEIIKWIKSLFVKK